jgi:multidrug efflux pump subunit AcrA (membrane-fusion protein)
MNRFTRSSLITALICTLLLSACAVPSAAVPAQTNPPTPTPLPPDPVLERPTYIVQRGAIERVLEVNGRVTPVDLVRLSFAENGRVADVQVARGDTVQAGDLLATLNQEAALEALQQAELAVSAAERDLAAARTQQSLAGEQARLRLSTAQANLQRLLGGPTAQERAAAQDALTDAQRALETARRTTAAAKAEAETALEAAADAVRAAQDRYSDLYWAAQQAPSGAAADAAVDALVAAERDLRAAERGREHAQLALAEARRAEIEQVRAAETAVARAERDLAQLSVIDPADPDIAGARQAVAEAELDVRIAQQADFAREQTAIDAAHLDLAQAQRVIAAGRIVAPQDGVIVAVALRPGDQVEAFAPLIELANPENLEVAAELASDQIRQLGEGQPAEIRLLARPDLPLPAVIRRLPIGGSGVVQAEDRTTRLQITDLRGLTLEANAVVQIRIVLERKTAVLLLPPEAVRSFEGRRFVVVRDGERERRVPVRSGIETPALVEILEGVAEGDVIVGQ